MFRISTMNFKSYAGVTVLIISILKNILKKVNKRFCWNVECYYIWSGQKQIVYDRKSKHRRSSANSKFRDRK